MIIKRAKRERAQRGKGKREVEKGTGSIKNRKHEREQY